ncbi:MliC family protein [Roseovarius aestuarii]|nr:MliC family protein [Roseovarius aestuarii]
MKVLKSCHLFGMFFLAQPLAVFAQTTGEAQFDTVTYVCERGVEIPVTYISTDANAYAVAMIEGRQIAMEQARAGSGVLYVSIDEQASYRWHTKGDDATLSFLAADHTAEEETLLRECTTPDA